MVYYYEIAEETGEKYFMKCSAEPKDPRILCEILNIRGTVKRITEREYNQLTKGAEDEYTR